MSQARFDRLTADQRARMPEWRDRWIAIGLSTERADWNLFERSVRACYRFAGLPEPRVIVRVDSPLILALAAPIAAWVLDRWATGGRLAVGDAVSGAVSDAVGSAVHYAVGSAASDAVRDAVSSAVHYAVGSGVGSPVQDAVSDAVRDAVRDAVGSGVGSAVGGAVGGAVHYAVHDAVSDAVRGAVRDAVGSAVHYAVGSAVSGAVRDAVGSGVGSAVGGGVGSPVQDAFDSAFRIKDYVRKGWNRIAAGRFWLGWWWGPPLWSFFRDVCGLRLAGDLWARAEAYEGTAKGAYWWWPHREFIVVSDRPSVLRCDDVGRLHAADGPAIAWPDGWGIYAWHGVRVPRDAIESPDSLTPRRIAGEPNSEIRRVMLERFGTERYIKKSGAQRVQTDDWGTLWRADFQGDEPLMMVEVVNSTLERDGSSKTYYLRVPPNLRTAREAVAWTFDESGDFASPKAYSPKIQT